MRAAILYPVALVLAGCGSSGETGNTDEPTPVAKVETAFASAGGTAETVNAYGIAEQAAGNEHALTTQVEATLTKVEAPTGTSVGAGQVVATLALSANARLDIGKAQTDAKSARDAFARAVRLRRDGLNSDADVNSARATYESAAQALKSAQSKAATLVLRAPIAGTVQSLAAKPGDLIAAGTTVATIGSRGELRVHFGVDPSIAARVRTGQPVSLSPVNAQFASRSKVVGVDPQVDPATHLASVYATLPPGQGIGPGQPVRGSITVSGSAPGVIIPYSALMDDGGHSYVWVVQMKVAKRRDVRPGNSSGDTVQILEGLQPNERVVTQGGTALEDGMKVTDQVATARSRQRQ